MRAWALSIGLGTVGGHGEWGLGRCKSTVEYQEWPIHEGTHEGTHKGRPYGGDGRL